MPARNYFALLGLPPTYEIEPIALKERYLALLQQYHPDHYGTTPQDRQLAMRMTIEIHTAYHTLKDPLLRATHYLALFAKEEEEPEALSESFLEEHLAFCDTLRAAQTLPEIKRLEKQVIEWLTTAEAAITHALQPSEERYTEVKRWIQKMQFYVKLQEETQKVRAALSGALMRVP